MSDETHDAPEFMDPADAEAPTERDPRALRAGVSMPPRGVALSVLFWLDDAERDGAR